MVWGNTVVFIVYDWGSYVDFIVCHVNDPLFIVTWPRHCAVSMIHNIMWLEFVWFRLWIIKSTCTINFHLQLNFHLEFNFGLNLLLIHRLLKTFLAIWWSRDDVIKWKHFPRYWPFVQEIHRSPVNSPHKGQWCGALMFSLICVWING